MTSSTHALALCALGLEKVCVSEIQRLGIEVEGRESGRVRFLLGASGAAVLMRANLCLRSAERVLIEVGRFHAENFDELFEQVRSHPWEAYFGRDDKLAIERVRLHDSQLAAQTSVQSVVHKAVYDRLGAVYRLSRLPESGVQRGLRVYIDRDECVLGLDSSGDALHKRGYRRSAGEAPLKETLAAGILFLSGWNRRLPLLDPFCGSGTIAIEAALLAMDRAPGLGRHFGLEGMPFVERAAVSGEVEAARGRVRRDVEFRIEGCDSDPRAIDAARANAGRAGLSQDRLSQGLVFRQAQAEEAAPGYEAGYLLCNPPYGERMGTREEAESLYRRLGETAARFTGWGLGFVTNRPDFGDFFGRRATTARKIVNGAEEQWFHWYPTESRIAVRKE
ncbi:MAG: THUMP domain-containing class I SAM-dependent RNA methyltransferase [Rectinemataceae bacterium]